MGAGNLELVKLLVKRKAGVTSKNKNGKTAADLARDPAIKEVLNEAALAASKSQEDAVRCDTNGAEPPRLSHTADVQKHSNTNDQGDADIGPQERPPEVVQDDDNAAAPLDKQPTIEQSSAGKSAKTEHQVQSRTSDPESYRPSKMQKVALSFAEEDNADEVRYKGIDVIIHATTSAVCFPVRLYAQADHSFHLILHTSY